MTPSDQTAEAMYAYYQQGHSLADVATEFGRARQTVHNIFRRRGWPLRRIHNKPSLPWAPLDRQLPDSARDAAEILGITRRSVVRYRTTGAFPAEHADAFAVAVGLHPLNLWPEWVGPIASPEDRAEAA